MSLPLREWQGCSFAPSPTIPSQWGPWRILRSPSIARDHRSAIADDYSNDHIGLIELGTIVDAKLQTSPNTLAPVLPGRLLNSMELWDVRVVYLSASEHLHDRIKQLYMGSHEALSREFKEWLENGYAFVIRILQTQEDPFDVREQIRESIMYNYHLHCPEEDVPVVH